MTGFGRGSASVNNSSISVELKTVNNRFLDINLKLPAELQSLETAIKRQISNRLSRGRVEINLQYDRVAGTQFELNRPVITAYLSAMQEMKDDFGLSGEPDINVMARLPNVVTTKQEKPEPEFLAAVEGVFDIALDELEAMRENEGCMLKQELSLRLDEIKIRLPVIEAEAAKVADEFQARITKRINEMLAKVDADSEVDQARLAQEIAYLAERADISEEITRLNAHIDHYRVIMDEDSEVGKRLDFLTQELNREANTIASKTNNMTVKENALAIKSEIEKIREQIQNIE